MISKASNGASSNGDFEIDKLLFACKPEPYLQRDPDAMRLCKADLAVNLQQNWQRQKNVQIILEYLCKRATTVKPNSKGIL